LENSHLSNQQPNFQIHYWNYGRKNNKFFFSIFFIFYKIQKKKMKEKELSIITWSRKGFE
jgi:hypothetical protein